MGNCCDCACVGKKKKQLLGAPTGDADTKLSPLPPIAGGKARGPSDKAKKELMALLEDAKKGRTPLQLLPEEKTQEDELETGSSTSLIASSKPTEGEMQKAELEWRPERREEAKKAESLALPALTDTVYEAVREPSKVAAPAKKPEEKEPKKAEASAKREEEEQKPMSDTRARRVEEEDLPTSVTSAKKPPEEDQSKKTETEKTSSLKMEATQAVHLEHRWVDHRVSDPWPPMTVGWCSLKSGGPATEVAVALVYQHGFPVMGRAWKDPLTFTTQVSFGYSGRELNSTSASFFQLLCTREVPARGYEYAWLTYAELMGNALGWEKVHESKVAPCVCMDAEGREWLGQMDWLREAASFAADGKVYRFEGPAVLAPFRLLARRRLP